MVRKIKDLCSPQVQHLKDVLTIHDKFVEGDFSILELLIERKLLLIAEELKKTGLFEQEATIENITKLENLLLSALSLKCIKLFASKLIKNENNT